jgi:hypothetical protein
MKYIKKFKKEVIYNIKPKYKIDDYIIVNFGEKYIYKGYCIIINRETSSTYSEDGLENYLYEVKYMDKEKFELFDLLVYLDDSDIERKMTKDEIEEFELILATNKYNL